MRSRTLFTLAVVLGAGSAGPGTAAQPATARPGVGSYLCADVRDDGGERVEAQMMLAPDGTGIESTTASVAWSAPAGGQGFHLRAFLSGERRMGPADPHAIDLHFPIERRLSQPVRIEIVRPSRPGSGRGYSGAEIMFASPYYRFRPARAGLNPGHEREVQRSALLDDLRALMNGVGALDVALVREGGPGELRSDRILATGRIDRAMLDRPRQAFLEARARLDRLAADYRNLCTPQPPDEPIIVAGGPGGDA